MFVSAPPSRNVELEAYDRYFPCMTAKIHENKELRNRSRVFADRFDAGERLGRMLAPQYREEKNLFLLAIPMGGVPVALKVKEALACPMDLIVVRKIQLPYNTEAGFGAMTQEGDVFVNETLVRELGLTDKQIETQTNKVREDLANPRTKSFA